MIDATPYQGKRVRLAGWVRTRFPFFGFLNRMRRQAQAWLRVDGPNGQIGFFDNMDDRPIRSVGWQRFEIVGDIALDAVRINFGMLLLGDGKAWLDGLELDVLGDATEGNLPPCELDARQLENVVALTRLLGYVRYFHPTVSVSKTNWNTVAIHGMRCVQEATSEVKLAEALRSVFEPIAPTVQIGVTREELELPVSGASSGKNEKVRFHEHHGEGHGYLPYFSQFVTSKKPPVIPAEPIIAELCDGVFALVPTAIPTKSKGIFEGTPMGADAFEDVPSHWRPSGMDRSTRLAGVALAWNVFQHFYPYFDVVDVDWHDTLRRSLASAAKCETVSAFGDTLKRLVSDLQDGHGVVAGTEMSCLPNIAFDWVEDSVVVSAVGPGVDERLRPGDVVTEIDGQDIHTVVASITESVSAATEGYLRFVTLSQLGSGSVGSFMTIKVRSINGEEKTIEARRETSQDSENWVGEPRPTQCGELADGVVYIDLSRIKSTDEFDDLVPRIAEAKGIVFDLRGYPSFDFTRVVAHLIDESVTSPQFHIPKVYSPDRRDMQFTVSSWNIRPKSPRFTENVAFVTDSRAISAAETFLGIVEHYELAEIVGQSTAGTNGNINFFKLPGGYRITWTGMRVLKHDGSQHHGVGIQPTISVSRTIAGVAEGHDELLERAVEAVAERT